MINTMILQDCALSKLSVDGMRLLATRLKFNDLTRVPRRCKNGPDHWSTLRKKVSPKDKALKHFDDFYQSVYGDAWQPMRTALLKQPSKYVAVVNNFGDVQATIERFETLGAIDVKSIYDAQKANLPFREARAKAKKPKEEDELKSRLNEIKRREQKAELETFYPEDAPDISLEEAAGERDTRALDTPLSPVQMRSIDDRVSDSERSRVVSSTGGVTASTLHEYVPATKIKGLDDWVLESQHYNYYDRGSDFSVRTERDPALNFPKHLKVYAFEALNDSRFPSPGVGNLGVYNYYLMDGGSLLPVLALDLQPGDTVLDMCAAPGGKALAALQTLMPRVLVANDSKLSRVGRLNDVIEEYFGDMDVWKNRLYVTNKDARDIDDADMFNKILVDVPCTTDRHVLHEDDNNLFKGTRLRERLQLPEVQSAILAQALKIVAPGGTVVYSTCSLSPIQNDGVVQMALKKNWEDTQSVMVVMDMMEGLEPLRCLYKFGNHGLKYGHIVLPSKANNWGPMYFCKVMRVQ